MRVTEAINILHEIEASGNGEAELIDSTENLLIDIQPVITMTGSEKYELRF